MKNDKMKVVRELLSSLWRMSSLRGSTCWGPKSVGNSYSGKNLVMVFGKEAVMISEGPNGKPIIHEFTETKDTTLGRRVGMILAIAGVPYIKKKSRPTKSLEMVAQEVLFNSNCLWYCQVCRQGDAVDVTSDSDYQAALKKAYEKHGEVSLGCDASHVKVYQMIDGRLTEMKELSLIVGAKIS